MVARPKRFAGYGASLGGRDYAEVDPSRHELRNVYLPPFKAAINADAGKIIASYMALHGVPAAMNGWLLYEVLRKEWGFGGFVVINANGANALLKRGAAGDDTDLAARAKCRYRHGDGDVQYAIVRQ